MSTSSARAIARCVASRSAICGRAAAWNFGATWPARSSLFSQPADAVGVLRMDHHQRALVSCQREHVKDLAVAQLERVVGHIDLERCVAVADERGQLLTQDLRGRIGDDKVKRVIDEGLAIGAAMVVGDRFAEALALHLGRERHQRRRPAACRRPRSAGEVVGHNRLVPGRLVEMAVRIDPAGQHQETICVDFASAGWKINGECGDPAVAHSDVGSEHVGGGGCRPSADNEIELRHSFPPPEAVGSLILNAKFCVRKGIHWLRDECQVAISLS